MALAQPVTLALVTVPVGTNPDSSAVQEGDLLLTNSQLTWIRADDQQSVIAQKLRIRLRFFAGEWSLDTTQGLPYFTLIFVKNPNLPRVKAIFRQVILTTPGIASLQTFSLVLDSTRTATVTFSALMDHGKIFTSADFGAFVVGV